MRAVVQRVSKASVRIGGREHAAIGPGFVVLAGVARGDDEADVAYLADKVANLRVLADDAGRMNRSVLDTEWGRIAGVAVHVDRRHAEGSATEFRGR